MQMQIKDRVYRWWYSLIAGLHEYSKKNLTLDNFEPEYWKSALAIEYLNPTYHFIENTLHRNVYAWKSKLFNESPKLVIETYLALAENSALKKNANLAGIDELLNNELLKSSASHVSLYLLQKFNDLDAQALRLLLVDASRSNPAKLLELIDSRLDNIDWMKVENYELYLAIGFSLSFEKYKDKIDLLKDSSLQKTIWAIRDLSGLRRYPHQNEAGFDINQLEFLIRTIANEFMFASHPTGVMHGDRNPWDATDFFRSLLNMLASTPSEESCKILQGLKDDLSSNAGLASYSDYIKHALASQRVRLIDAKFQQPSYSETLATLANLQPANIADFQALVIHHLQDIQNHISSGNTDIYKRFWNEGSFGKISKPKVEDSCRDVLVDLLRSRLKSLNIFVEPEGHMASDKRADMVITLPTMKLVVELKRDCHSEVWEACQNQLDRLYTRDPDASGYGIYLVFWYGLKGNNIPSPPNPLNKPKSAEEMKIQLQSLIPLAKQPKLKVVVIDVSGQIS